jgi:hypothetical protein
MSYRRIPSFVGAALFAALLVPAQQWPAISMRARHNHREMNPLRTLMSQCGGRYS